MTTAKHLSCANRTLLCTFLALALAHPAVGQEQADRPDDIHTTLAYPTGDQASSILLLEKIGPAQVRVGQQYNYEIRVTNISDDPVAGVVVVESLAPGFQFQSSEPQNVPSETQGQLQWGLGQLQPNESRAIKVTTIPGQEGVLGGCLAVTCEPALCTTVEVIRPAIALRKLGPAEDTLYACAPVRIRYVVTNTGSGTASGVVVEEPLPEGLATKEGQKAIRWEVGDIPEGESRSFDVELQASKAGEYQGRAVARYAGEEVFSDDVAFRLVQPQLAVQVTGPQWQYYGQPVTFEVEVTNTGDVAAREAVLRLDGPGLSDDEKSRKLGDIEPGQNKRFAVTVEGSKADQIQITAEAESYCAQSQQGQAMAQLRRVPALLLETVDNYDPVPVGESTSYTVAVKNQGSGAAANVQLMAQLPPELQFVQASGPTNVRAEGQQLVFDTIQSLPPGEVAVYVVEMKATQAGDARFRVELSSEFLQQPTPDVEPTRVLPAGTAVAGRWMPSSPQEPIPSEASQATAQSGEAGIDQPDVQVGATDEAQMQQQQQQPAPQQPAQPPAAPRPTQPEAAPPAPQPAPQQ